MININTVFFSQKQFLPKELLKLLHLTVLAVKMNLMHMKVCTVSLQVNCPCKLCFCSAKLLKFPQPEASL